MSSTGVAIEVEIVTAQGPLVITGPGDAIVSVKDSHNHPPNQAFLHTREREPEAKAYHYNCHYKGGSEEISPLPTHQ